MAHHRTPTRSDRSRLLPDRAGSGYAGSGQNKGMATSPTHPDSFGTRSRLRVGGRDLEIFSLAAAGLGDHDVARLPYTLKVLLENLLRHEDGLGVSASDIAGIASWASHGGAGGTAETAQEIAFSPERVLMQDLTGVPGVVDLAAMRDAIIELGGNPGQINPLVPVELVTDHSVIAERSGDSGAFDANVEIEYQRNLERYQLLRWAQSGFEDFRVVPPGTGICHQVNLEHLARVVFEKDGAGLLRHVGRHRLAHHHGQRARRARLGRRAASRPRRPCWASRTRCSSRRSSGCGSSGRCPRAPPQPTSSSPSPRSCAATGSSASSSSATGPASRRCRSRTGPPSATCRPSTAPPAPIFPIDETTISYLRFTGRDEDHLALVEAYAKAPGPLARGRRGRARLHRARRAGPGLGGAQPGRPGPAPGPGVALGGRPELPLGTGPRSAIGAPRHGRCRRQEEVDDGDVVIAAITSCTNTSNPQVMVGAGLLAKRAVERGLRAKPWVKTSLAPGSRVVMDYLERAGLVEPLDALGFYLVGFGCTTCIGNSGPLKPGVSEAVQSADLSVAAVLSGNRNFEGRIHPDVRHELPRLTAARGRLRTRRDDGRRPHHRPHRDGERRQPGAPGRAVAERAGDRRDHPDLARLGHVPDPLRGGVRRRRPVEGDPGRARSDVRVGPRLHLRAAAAVPRRHGPRAHAGRRHRGCAGARGARRQRDHRPHLAGRVHWTNDPRRPLPHRARGGAGRLQLLWHPPRQPRGDGPGHVRQRAAAQSARAGHRGRVHPAPPRRRADHHL